MYNDSSILGNIFFGERNKLAGEKLFSLTWNHSQSRFSAHTQRFNYDHEWTTLR